MRIDISDIVYFYIFICASLLAFNIAYILRSRGRSRKRERQARRWGERIDAALKNLSARRDVGPAHREAMRRELRKAEALMAYHEAMEPRLKHPMAQAYFDRNHPIFQELAVAYMRRPAMERAFFAHLMAVYHPCQGRVRDQLPELLLGYLDNSTVYCRENVVKALCALGNAGAVQRAVTCFHEQGWYHQPHLLADGLTGFAGDREALARRLWAVSAEWNERLRVAVVQFAGNLRGDLSDVLLPALVAADTPTEVRFALIRYFQRHPNEGARPVLLQMAASGAGEGGFAIAACAALVRYPGAETRRVLVEALHSRNWYVRRNAATSLAALGVTESELAYLRERADRYADEMLAYMARIQGKGAIS